MAEKLTDCEIRLREMVDGYADDCSSGRMQFSEPEEKNYYEPYSWEYVIDQWNNVTGVIILLAGGGPVIWLNTREQVVEGYWGSDSYKKPIYEFEYVIDYFAERYIDLTDNIKRAI